MAARRLTARRLTEKRFQGGEETRQGERFFPDSENRRQSWYARPQISGPQTEEDGWTLVRNRKFKPHFRQPPGYHRNNLKTDSSFQAVGNRKKNWKEVVMGDSNANKEIFNHFFQVAYAPNSVRCSPLDQSSTLSTFIDSKSFVISLNNSVAKNSIMFSEWNKSKVITCFLNLEEGFWLSNILISEANLNRSSQQLWQFRVGSDWIIAFRNKNKFGPFVKLMISKNISNPKYFFIPCGFKFSGWLKLGNDLRSLCSPSSSAPAPHSPPVSIPPILPPPPPPAPSAAPPAPFLPLPFPPPPLSSPPPCISRWSRAILLDVSPGIAIWNSVLKWFCSSFRLTRFISIHPISKNQAIFFAVSDSEFNSILKSFSGFSGDSPCKISKWSEILYPNSPPVSWSDSGTWISVRELPHHLWSPTNFKIIGDRCGGLLEIHRDTIDELDFIQPKIRVRGPFPVDGLHCAVFLDGEERWLSLFSLGFSLPDTIFTDLKVSGDGQRLCGDPISDWTSWKLTECTPVSAQSLPFLASSVPTVSAQSHLPSPLPFPVCTSSVLSSADSAAPPLTSSYPLSLPLNPFCSFLPSHDLANPTSKSSILPYSTLHPCSSIPSPSSQPPAEPIWTSLLGPSEPFSSTTPNPNYDAINSLLVNPSPFLINTSPTQPNSAINVSLASPLEPLFCPIPNPSSEVLIPSQANQTPSLINSSLTHPIPSPIISGPPSNNFSNPIPLASLPNSLPCLSIPPLPPRPCHSADVSPAPRFDPSLCLPVNENLSSPPLSTLFSRQLQKKFKKKAKQIPFIRDPLHSNDRLLFSFNSNSESKVADQDDISSSRINKVKDAIVSGADNSNGATEDFLIEKIVSRINKEFNSNFTTIYSALRDVSEAMGVQFPTNDNLFVSKTCKIIEGHAEAFKDVENN